MKKTLKVLAIAVGVLVIGLAISFLLLVRSLPSTWQIKQVMSPRKAQSPEFVAQTQTAPDATGKITEKDPRAQGRSHEDKVDESKALSMQVLKDDFMNEKKPLSTVCAYLGSATQSHFLRNDDSGSANEFMKSLSENNKDPLAESAVPLFRYLFRMDTVRELVDTIEKAEADKDEGILKKAEFYAKLGLAAQEMRANKASFDRILMKSYNLFMLSRAVGKHPELARDPATLNYCDQIEKNINLSLDFNADEQVAEMQKFLDYAKVDPKEIGYDSKYRSDVKFELSNKSLTLNHIWIEKLFAKDINKAEKELKAQKIPESEASGL
jgi:hypothetical protein